MKWPWQRASDNRATLTFLPDGTVILGLPHGMNITQAAAAEIRDKWNTGVAEGKPVIFGFPVDVVDLRKAPA